METKGSSGRSWSVSTKEVPSQLIGRIVEKGFSSTSKPSPTSLPKPTVLPFPIARHRSHGPHWAPLSSETVDGKDDGEDMDNTDFDPVAAYANPIERKPKKGLDFSKWRKLVPEDSLPVKKEKKFDNLAPVSSEERREALPNASLANTDTLSSHEKLNPEPLMESSVDLDKNGDMVVCDSGIGVPDLAACVEQNRLDSLPVQGSPEDDRTRFQGARPDVFEDSKLGSSSAMNDIDAENRALLQKMSPDEIAEAQDEIMGRMKPGILEILKKRGQDKLRKQKVVTSDPVVEHPSGAEHDRKRSCQESKSTQLNEGAKASDAVDTAPTKSAGKGPDYGSLLKSPGVADSSSWNLWTERVEKARKLRFSLDGSVVGIDPLQVPASRNSIYQE